MTDIRKARGSRRYKRMRRAYLAENPRCAECERQGERRAAEELDHVVPVSEGGGMFDWDNLQGLCGPCHAAKTAGENTVDIPGRAEWIEHVERMMGHAI